MPKIGEIAKVIKRGGGIPAVTDELAYNAYCLYEAVKADMATADNYSTVSRNDVMGWEGKVSVPSAFRSLWPELPRNPNDEETTRVRKALYQYLKSTGNLVCISTGSFRKMSTWWVRSEWNDSVTEPQQIPDAPAASEEPGEFSCEYCKKNFRGQYHLTRHIYLKHQDLTDIILSALDDFYGAGIQSASLARRMKDGYGYDGSEEIIRVRLIVMAGLDDGLVHSSKDGRFVYYRLDESPTPEKYDAVVQSMIVNGYSSPAIPCRDPGCEATFSNLSSRLIHEDRAHPDSPWRVWHCAVCKMMLYNVMAWGVHTSSVHHLTRSSREYLLLKREASSNASALLERLANPDSVGTPAPAETPTQLPLPLPELKTPVLSDLKEDTVTQQAESMAGILEGQTETRLSDFSSAIKTVMSTVESLTQENAELKTRNSDLKTKLRASILGSKEETPASEPVAVVLTPAVPDSALLAENAELKNQLEALKKIISNIR